VIFENGLNLFLLSEVDHTKEYLFVISCIMISSVFAERERGLSVFFKDVKAVITIVLDRVHHHNIISSWVLYHILKVSTEVELDNSILRL
jgi:hypothetical protein